MRSEILSQTGSFTLKVCDLLTKQCSKWTSASYEEAKWHISWLCIALLFHFFTYLHRCHEQLCFIRNLLLMLKSCFKRKINPVFMTMGSDWNVNTHVLSSWIWGNLVEIKVQKSWWETCFLFRRFLKGVLKSVSVRCCPIMTCFDHSVVL